MVISKIGENIDVVKTFYLGQDGSQNLVKICMLRKHVTWDRMDLAWKALFAVAPSATNSDASCFASLKIYPVGPVTPKHIICARNIE